MNKKNRTLSATPRAPAHSRKIHFSIAMRENISKRYVAARKKIAKKKK